MIHSRIGTAAGALLLAATMAAAQTAPRRATTVVVPSSADGAKTPPYSVSLSVRGAAAQKFLTVKANNADVRDLFREMGTRSATTVLLADSATGTVSVDLKDKPLDEVMQAVAAAASLPLRVLTVPEASAATLTSEAAGQISDALAALPASAAVTDPATGKTLVVEAKAAAPAAGATRVYFLQGRYTAAQELAMKTRQAADAEKAAAPASAITNAVQSINQMPVQQRIEAMREMNRQMWQNMSDSDRQAMREQFRNNRGGRRDRGRNRN